MCTGACACAHNTFASPIRKYRKLTGDLFFPLCIVMKGSPNMQRLQLLSRPVNVVAKVSSQIPYGAANENSKPDYWSTDCTVHVLPWQNHGLLPVRPGAPNQLRRRRAHSLCTRRPTSLQPGIYRKLALVEIIPNGILSLFSDKDRRTDSRIDPRRGCAVFVRLIHLSVL